MTYCLRYVRFKKLEYVFHLVPSLCFSSRKRVSFTLNCMWFQVSLSCDDNNVLVFFLFVDEDGWTVHLTVSFQQVNLVIVVPGVVVVLVKV